VLSLYRALAPVPARSRPDAVHVAYAPTGHVNPVNPDRASSPGRPVLRMVHVCAPIRLKPGSPLPGIGGN
jgi:hypothetical protein